MTLAAGTVVLPERKPLLADAESAGVEALGRRTVEKSTRKLRVEQLDLLILHQALDSLVAKATVVSALNQIEVHPYFQQKALQRVHAKRGIVTQAWSPIGGITSYRQSKQRSFDDPTLLAIGKQHGKSAAQVMLRWHLQEGRSAIPKSVKPERIAENFDVFDLELTAEQIAAIDALDTGVRWGPEPDVVTLEKFGRVIPEA